MFERALIVGASRGLGKSLAHFAKAHLDSLNEMTIVSRKPLTFKEADCGVSLECLQLDMSKEDDQVRLEQLVLEKQFDLVIYAAGGGPHGKFAEKNYRDHEWALKVNLMAPMRLARA